MQPNTVKQSSSDTSTVKKTSDSVASRYTNTVKKAKFAERVQAMKLRQAMKSLKSVGITPEQAIKYIKDNGFETREQTRQEALSQYRTARATKLTRQTNQKKAVAARTRDPQPKEVKGLEKTSAKKRTPSKTPSKQIEALTP